MGQINVTKCPIEGPCIIEPKVYRDSRGYFVETYNRRDYENHGFKDDFVQDNQSMSVKGTLRGLHFQIIHPQGKLVRVVSGRVFDVVVDIRGNSKTFGKWFGIELTSDSMKQLYIPEGFAHGFLVLSDVAELSYKCSEFYSPDDEGGIAWNDPEIGIEWPQVSGVYKGSASAEGYVFQEGTALTISQKDQKWQGIKHTFRRG